MDSTNVNSSNMTMTFVICGVDKEVEIRKARAGELGEEFKAEIQVYDNKEKDLKRKRRTIPISCEKKLARKKQEHHVIEK